jgi:hypothetical protein
MWRVIVLLLCSWVGLASAESSTFDQNTNVLTIPSLQIGNGYYSNTRLQLSPSGQWSVLEFGAPTSAITPLSVTPASFSARVGDELAVSITGGTPPYSVIATSSNIYLTGITHGTRSAMASVFVLRSGSATIVVTDSASNQASSTLTTMGSEPPSVSPASAAVRTGSGVTLFISGGTPPYSVNSTNTHVVRLDNISQANPMVASAVVTLYTIGEGAATILISDAYGAHSSMTITTTR